MPQVAEVLYAHMKDRRYASHCIQYMYEILQDVGLVLDDTSNDTSSNDNNDDNNTLNRFRRLSTQNESCNVKNLSVFVGSMLYVILMCVRSLKSGKELQTLGMEYIGVQMSPGSTNNALSAKPRSRISSFFNLVVLQTFLPYILLRYPRIWIRRRRGFAETSDTLNSPSLEGLRGNARRKVFLEQRRRMQALASSTKEGFTEHIISQPLRRDDETTEVTSDERISSWDKLRKFFLSWIIENEDDSRSEIDGSRIQHRISLSRLLRYLMRLHISLYLINGKFDKLSNRITGTIYRATHESSSGDTSDCGSDRYIPSYDTIGYLMLVELFMTGLSSVSEASIELAIHAKMLLRRLTHSYLQRNQRQISSSVTNRTSTDNIESRQVLSSHHTSLLDGVNHKVPGKDISMTTNETLFHERNYQPVVICSICMNARRDPAAAPCGHIFCWKCIVQHTLSSSTKECPLCRIACSPQDISLLHNYR